VVEASRVTNMAARVLSALLVAAAASAAPVLPSPSCLLNGDPCPPPAWPPVWGLAQSTYVFPSDKPAAAFPPFAPLHPWGMVQLDWAVGGTVWLKPNRSESTCEAQSVANCAALKASGKAQRCLVYHNL
jgi:hypothetical protein